jgi:hypothetical protein
MSPTNHYARSGFERGSSFSRGSLFLFLIEVFWVLTHILNYGSWDAETWEVLIRLPRVGEGVAWLHLLDYPFVHDEDAESVYCDEETDEGMTSMYGAEMSPVT